MTKIEELKAAFSQATPGDWGVMACNYPHEDWYNLFAGPHGRAKMIQQFNGGDNNLGDATFIALSHNLMPQLLEAVERLEAMQRVIGELASMNPFLRDVFDTNKTVLERLK